MISTAAAAAVVTAVPLGVLDFDAEDSVDQLNDALAGTLAVVLPDAVRLLPCSPAIVRDAGLHGGVPLIINRLALQSLS